MRQNDAQKEKEITVRFANHVLDGADALGFTMSELACQMIHIIACSLPANMDEELLRDLMREFHLQIHSVLHERRKINARKKIDPLFDV